MDEDVPTRAARPTVVCAGGWDAGLTGGVAGASSTLRPNAGAAVVMLRG